MNDIFIRIPHPKTIPALCLCRIEEYPEAMTDRNILEIQADIPVNVEIPVLAFPLLKELLAKIGHKNLSEPQYIGKVDVYEFFACLNEDKKLIFMQTRYYQYFKDKYPGCIFSCSGIGDPIGVTHDDKIVGIFMPLFIPEEMANKIYGDMASS